MFVYKIRKTSTNCWPFLFFLEVVNDRELCYSSYEGIGYTLL